jgi:hypothetical protein
MVFEADACGQRAQDAPLREAPSPHIAPDPHDTLCSVREHCEQLLVELFGREVAASATAARAGASVYELLARRHSACHVSRGDLRALAPCSEVNRSLGRLVAIIQGDHAPHTLQPDSSHEQALRAQLLARLDACPELGARARHLRSIAGLAEHALEQHWSNQLLPRVRSLSPMSHLAPIGPLRVRALAACFEGFPYTRNYLRLTAAELGLLERPARPQVLRTAERRALPPDLGRDFERALLQLNAAHAPDHAQMPTPWPARTITVGGCGPLPVTGLLLHASTGARVQLLDRDTSALTAAQTWVSELERLNVLERGAVSVREADIANLTLTPQSPADALLIASLVDTQAKEQLACRWQQQPVNALLLLRSARGLCAALAYQPVATYRVSHLALPFCGESVPEHLVEPGEHNVLVRAPRAVLNTTELFRSLPLSAAQRHALTPLALALSHARDN